MHILNIASPAHFGLVIQFPGLVDKIAFVHVKVIQIVESWIAQSFSMFGDVLVQIIMLSSSGGLW